MMIKDHLIDVDVEFEYGSSWRQYANVNWKTRILDGEKTVYDVRLQAPGFRNFRSITWWSSHDSPNNFTLYWPPEFKLEDIFSQEKKS